MPVLISGVLKDGAGTPVQNCTIQLKACRTSTTVVVNTVASENPDDAGRYSMDVEQGQYAVTLLVEGYPPSHAGVITVYDDSKPGTLNDFLGAMTEDDVRPEALRRFEAMVEEVARQASEALRNATAAGQASEQAQTSAERAGASETAAKMSETQAASSAGETGASATAAAASEKAAAASAAEAKTSETNAATSANTAAASATAASSSASAASTHAAASDTSASLAAQSSTAAGAAATRAEDAAKRAEDIADVISLEDASLTKKGIVKLSSAADSDSEVLAATPKAVKTVMGEVQTKAPLDSPAFTGTPTTPTPPDDAKGLQTANAEFVRKLIAALVGSVPESLDTLQELADALGNDPNFATTVLNKLAGKQPLDDTLTALSGKSVDGLIEYVGLRETINRAAGALQKDQNGADIPDKKQFARTIGAVTSTSVTFGESGWFKIATVFMPQATSTAVIKLYGGSGFNVGSFEQAAISELVLRAGNGSPVGITATLWRRSPAAANEIAWINTSGDSYDIYINIGRYAYGLIAQYDCTSNAGVILHTSPEFSETKPANATNGQTYTLFNSLMKPTAGDVEALSVSGGRLNGPLGIGTDNALGGNSIVFGDNDTGLKQNGDGILDIFANNQHTVRVAPGEMIVLGAIRAGNGKKLSLTSTNNSALNAGFNLWGDGGNRPTVIELGDDQGWHLYSQRNTDGSIQFVVNGQVIPDNYGNFDARYLSSGNVYTKGESDNRYVQNIQRGAPVWPGKVDEYGPAEAPAGCFLTQARHDPTTAYGVTFAYRPLQMWVGNGWRTING
ncbi:prophage tail fiber N-terminal domain-containing protein [Salmonella enterica]|uniref:Shikimate transporter n=6 Tax=Salmonella enterica TaxID=28901 RepID=A0A2T8WQI2_SALET|nr:prophage tail fiber N-terminal domain-containing protein [Salmonella enterica]EEE5077856.1 shikimate transporter [Salmonella enterica subsp. enterica serovar Thompson]EHR8661866.1 prophage tail fiber N-terminal domain-containing protein [Salmonella enterica subsp. enterica serovar Muenchen]ELJ2720442.1 prophage tail fiber N-terminal domain-containing protein [Salmonella enterica subsp. diarizonae]EAA8046921.1 shikimate transporter [Salmonella enterica]EAM2838414.1 shikimate transporter [Sal